MNLECILIIPDCHIPFEHKRAYQLMLDVAKYAKPKEIVILGDYADFYSVSSHSKDPRIFNMLKEEVESVIRRLDEIDKTFKNAKKIFIIGNHEYRLERYLCSTAPALFGTTSVEHIFNLNRRPNWKIIQYGPNQMHSVLDSYLYARHEPLGSSTKATAQKAMCSIVHGHTHQIAAQYTVGLKGDQHICYSPGWLGDKRKDQIFGYTKHHAQWNLGFSIVHSKGKIFYPTIVQIIEVGNKVSCSYAGKLFTR